MAAGDAAQRGRSGLATWALMFGIWLMASGSLDPASAVTGCPWAPTNVRPTLSSRIAVGAFTAARLPARAGRDRDRGTR